MSEGIGGAALPMDVVRQKRAKLQGDIAALVYDFCSETGCDVRAVTLSRVAHSFGGAGRDSKPFSLSVEVEVSL